MRLSRRSVLGSLAFFISPRERRAMPINWLVMDSFNGFGSNGLPGGGFAKDVAGDKWYWPDASVERSLNDLMVVNNVSERFAYMGFPANDQLPGAATEISNMISAGIVRSGDRIIIEEAGELPDNSDTVMTMFNDVISAANQTGITVKALTTIDTGTSAWQAMGYGSPPSNQRWDRTLTNGSVSRTGNQCIRDAMTAAGLTATECAADMLWCAQAMNGQTTIRIVQDDWIHPNMWGQWRLVRNILVACGLASSVTNIDPVKARVSANWQALQYNAPPNAQNQSNYWTQANALKAIDFCLKNVAF